MRSEGKEGEKGEEVVLVGVIVVRFARGAGEDEVMLMGGEPIVRIVGGGEACRRFASSREVLMSLGEPILNNKSDLL